MSTATPNPAKPAGPFFEIPLGTEPSKCRSCGQLVYFVTTKRGAPMPVSIAAEGCRAPDTFAEGQLNVFGGVDQPMPGRGVSHFSDCPDAEAWRARNRR